ncbi:MULTISPECIES: universal stress protein [Legionella]|uniref:Universal stress protein n=1 Tax=Legionella drozanskii LLAP-1 TaxID=1212489 RepID=A0A0W0TAF7_9GAMM|nr:MULTISPECIES: universal stress protein [Legionella]KTC92604.1 universal stress protein [Legionella drozanskii LLAP-1]PJE18203.1 MAG: universal stress protein [Legionella sp.]
MYKKIMLAIDGSNVSNAAVEEIIKLTKDQNVHLRIIHVVDENVAYIGPSFDTFLLINALKEEGKQILDDAEKKISSQTSLKVETSLIELKPLQGRVAEIIIEAAKEWSADLLVIGTHGRRGFNRLFLGSVAENTIRIAPIPVLLVRGPEA